MVALLRRPVQTYHPERRRSVLMRATPLLGPYRPDDVLAWRRGLSIRCIDFLSQVNALADSLPDRPMVLNLANDRYRFLVGLSAALVRGQTTLVPPGRAPKTLSQIAREYPDSYCLTDGQETVEGLSDYPFQSHDIKGGQACSIPDIPNDRIAALVFTSGTTGKPRPNPKSWGALVTVAQATGSRLELEASANVTVVATVPHQHMFGLETSLMLPLRFGLAFHAGRPLFPADVASALALVPPKRILITTPLHIRACVTERSRLPEVEFMLSATAPLPLALAHQAETMFQTKVFEVYGFAEAGSVATRRTVAGDRWRVLDGIRLQQESDCAYVQARHLQAPMPFPDVVSLHGPHEFSLHGRSADLVNIGGHRASLGDLNCKLNEIQGVEDGIFFHPDNGDAAITRLVAFVVAPAKSADEILTELRTAVDPVFLPRPLYLVPSLPRNETGKLTRDALRALLRQCDLANHRPRTHPQGD